jgi:hypothetical protein
VSGVDICRLTPFGLAALTCYNVSTPSHPSLIINTIKSHNSSILLNFNHYIRSEVSDGQANANAITLFPQTHLDQNAKSFGTDLPLTENEFSFHLCPLMLFAPSDYLINLCNWTAFMI